jgi:hypothetical protein
VTVETILRARPGHDDAPVKGQPRGLGAPAGANAMPAAAYYLDPPVRNALSHSTADATHLQHVRATGIAHGLAAGDGVGVTRLEHFALNQQALSFGQRLVAVGE